MSARKAKSAKPRTLETRSIPEQSIRRIVSDAIDNLLMEADGLQAIARALQEASGGCPTSSDAEDLRSVAAVVRAHALGALTMSAQLVAKAERLATVGDLRASGGPA